MAGIRDNVREILKELPKEVQLVAASKKRKPEEILEAIEAGVRIIGENYIKEAKKAYKAIGEKAKWHFIGIPKIEKHDLLRRKNLEMFDMIETIDNIELATEIDEKCSRINKIMPILIEINSGEESQKFGVLPHDAIELTKKISILSNVKVMGIMTMGPRFGKPENSRPYFIKTKKLFDQIKEMDLPNVKMKYLSMGMTNSYRIALEEGANMVRIGTKIFGERNKGE
jgi:pyridoxal phosphate enzyme (YggS family)